MRVSPFFLVINLRLLLCFIHAIITAAIAAHAASELIIVTIISSNTLPPTTESRVMMRRLIFLSFSGMRCSMFFNKSEPSAGITILKDGVVITFCGSYLNKLWFAWRLTDMACALLFGYKSYLIVKGDEDEIRGGKIDSDTTDPDDAKS